jgi:hypothetical protein
MERDEIIEMAREAGIRKDDVFVLGAGAFVAFAKLVAAKEREACANLCWKSADDNAFVNAYNQKRLDLLCSELIRSRGLKGQS